MRQFTLFVLLGAFVFRPVFYHLTEDLRPAPSPGVRITDEAARGAEEAGWRCDDQVAPKPKSRSISVPPRPGESVTH